MKSNDRILFPGFCSSRIFQRTEDPNHSDSKAAWNLYKSIQNVSTFWNYTEVSSINEGIPLSAVLYTFSAARFQVRLQSYKILEMHALNSIISLQTLVYGCPIFHPATVLRIPITPIQKQPEICKNQINMCPLFNYPGSIHCKWMYFLKRRIKYNQCS